jgi:hypothetical protein
MKRRLLVFPPSFTGRFSCYLLTLGWRELCCSRPSALCPSELAERNGCGVLASAWVFERRPVHLLANRLFNNATGDCKKIA